MDPSRQLVVGLGNPGPRYRDTRHNVGFLVVEALARRLGWEFRAGAGPWREAAAPDGRGPFTLLQPLTYMNLSGEAVLGWAAACGFDPRPVVAEPALPAPAPWSPLVVCDDLALPLGALRLRARGSSGGQKGLASVIGALGHEDVPRLRLGIAPAGDPVPAADWPDFVLTPFAMDEGPAVADLVARAADAVLCWAERGVDEAASRHNRR
jgi:peptidyl-tRNA hydrolase, PTH1 family